MIRRLSDRKYTLFAIAIIGGYALVVILVSPFIPIYLVGAFIGGLALSIVLFLDWMRLK